MRRVLLSELMLGFEGLALLRGLMDGDNEQMAARLAEVREIATKLEERPYKFWMDVQELDPKDGYAVSASSYDTVDNPLLRIEQPVVEEMLANVAPGDALDAACGTGRHAKHLAQHHRVTGVDASPEMLGVARESVPQGTFVEGDLTNLHLADASFDIVVCALALCHVKDLAPAVAELSRVARPGAKLIFTDPHPISIATVSHLFVPIGDRALGFVRNHFRTVGGYLEAFEQAGLRVVRCVEPLATVDSVGGMMSGYFPEAEKQAITGLPFAIVWELEKN